MGCFDLVVAYAEPDHELAADLRRNPRVGPYMDYCGCLPIRFYVVRNAAKFRGLQEDEGVIKGWGICQEKTKLKKVGNVWQFSCDFKSTYYKYIINGEVAIGTSYLNALFGITMQKYQKKYKNEDVATDQAMKKMAEFIFYGMQDPTSYLYGIESEYTEPIAR